MKTRIRIVKLETGRQTNRKSLLMDIFPEDKTFPIHPHIQIEPAGIIQQLQSHLRIGDHIQFRIVQWLYQIMIGRPIQIAQHDIHMIRQGHLRPEPRKCMKTFLILITFPMRNILISHIRIAIRPPKTLQMNTCFEFQHFQRIIDSLCLQPKSRQCIAFHKRTGILIILKETQIIKFDRKFPFLFRIYLEIRLENAVRNLGIKCVDK